MQSYSWITHELPHLISRGVLNNGFIDVPFSLTHMCSQLISANSVFIVHSLWEWPTNTSSFRRGKRMAKALLIEIVWCREDYVPLAISVAWLLLMIHHWCLIQLSLWICKSQASPSTSIMFFSLCGWPKMTSAVPNSFSKIALLLQFWRNNIEVKYKIEKLKVQPCCQFTSIGGSKRKQQYF